VLQLPTLSHSNAEVLFKLYPVHFYPDSHNRCCATLLIDTRLQTHVSVGCPWLYVGDTVGADGRRKFSLTVYV